MAPGKVLGGLLRHLGALAEDASPWCEQPDSQQGYPNNADRRQESAHPALIVSVLVRAVPQAVQIILLRINNYLSLDEVFAGDDNFFSRSHKLRSSCP